MTRIAQISDLHVNHWIRNADLKDKVEWVNRILNKIRGNYKFDKIIIVGDLWNGSVDKSFDFGDDVIRIDGNHDFYFSSFPKEPTVKLYSVKELSVAAGTLWTNFWNIKDSTEIQIFAGINDNYQIAGATSDSLRNMFEKELSIIRSLNTDIVVTHFPPTLRSIADQYLGNPYNPYFVNNMEDALIEHPNNTKLWLCGHVHHRHSYYIDDMLVSCNPLGYPGENYNSVEEYNPIILEDDENGKWRIC